MEKFEIRAAGPDDRREIIALMGNIYPGDMSARYEWLYLNNPHGQALSWLAVEAATGDAVGCTSIFPRRVKVGRRDRTGGIGGDCFIEPRARRQGLATRLHAASFDQMRERGVEFMYGPPTPNNLGALIKAGSHLVANYRRWVRPLTSRGAYRAAFSRVPTKGQAHLADIPIMMLDRLTRSDARGFTLEEVYEFGDEFNVMFERAAFGHLVVCVRDSDYLTWRYLEAPARRQVPLSLKRDGQVVGFAALERAGEFAAIADLFTAADPVVMDAMLQRLIEHASASGCSSLEISLTGDSLLARRLRRHGFVGRDERGFQVAVSDNDPQARLLLKAEAWHFTEADQDMDRVFVTPLSA